MNDTVEVDSKEDIFIHGDNESLRTEVDRVNWKSEKKLLRKLDRTLIPLFMIIYITNFIDRTAVGNAKIAGLETDLGLHGFQYNISLTVFYVVYILVEIPSNLALKHFGSVWIGFLIICFGVVSIGTAFVHNFSQLVVARVFLGLAEGGTLSALTYTMSRFYRRSELVMRIGIFFGCAPSLAGAFGGLISSGMLKLSDIGMVTSWRKIFLVEGIFTTGFGILCVWIVPDDPLNTKFLTEDERKLAIDRILADQVGRRSAEKEKTTLRLIGRAVNFNSCLCTLAFLLFNISIQGLSLFMPTVVATLGHYSTVQIQLRTVPPYLVAALYAVSLAFLSSRFKRRGIPILISSTLMVIGYAIFVGVENSNARYAACFLSIAGAAPIGPLLLSWGTENAAPETVRAVATAMIPGLGTIGSVIATWTYLPFDAPDYHHGNSLNLATATTICVLSIIGVLYVRRENRKRANGERDYRLEGKTTEEIENLGWKHPQFVYQE